MRRSGGDGKEEEGASARRSPGMDGDNGRDGGECECEGERERERVVVVVGSEDDERRNRTCHRQIEGISVYFSIRSVSKK
jgi:hypothetical protein